MKVAVLLTCAWILWVSGSGDPYPSRAFETKAECEHVAATEQERFAKVAREMIARGEVPKVFIGFQCLPDTIDPRRPK